MGIARLQLVRVEFLHGQQFHRGDTQLLQIRDLLYQPTIGPWMSDSGAGMHRESTHVGLVDDSFRPWNTQRAIVTPVEVQAREHTLWRERPIVQRRRMWTAAHLLWCITSGRVEVPRWNLGDGGRSRIQQQLAE